jgi:hypothetical protein
MGACCRIFHPHWFEECAEEYEEISHCIASPDPIYGEICTSHIVTGYTEKSMKELQNTTSWKNTASLGARFSVEGNTKNSDLPYMDQIRTKFITMKNADKDKPWLHTWECGLTNVFTPAQPGKLVNIQKRGDDCNCKEDSFGTVSNKLVTIKDTTGDTSKLYNYFSPPGFYVRNMQVFGKCQNSDGTALEVATGSIRAVAIPTPTACQCTNKWILLRKYSLPINVWRRIKITVPYVGVVWHAEPEETVLDFLDISLEGFMPNLTANFAKPFKGKEEEEWRATMRRDSITWTPVTEKGYEVEYRMRSYRVHMFFQLVGKCGSHFTIFTDRIKHVSVWSPQVCNATDEWVLVGKYSTRNLREKRIRHYLEIGVKSEDYRILRDFGVYYAHPSQDLKSRFIEQCDGKPELGELKRTYFNWNATQYRYNWEEFLLPSKSPLSLDTPEIIAENNRRQIHPVDLIIPANYTYSILQLQGRCGEHYSKTDRILEIRTRETSDCKAVETYEFLGYCDNSKDPVKRKSCTFEMKPFGVKVDDYTSEILVISDRQAQVGQIKAEIQQKFPDVDLSDECNWRTIFAPYNKTLCNANRTFEIPPSSTYRVEQLRIFCNEWRLYAYKFRGIDNNGHVEYDTPMPGSWRYLDGRLVSFNTSKTTKRI